jgi:multidrug efflux pump subunit AcrA (membrane-fusion protein)
MKTDEREVFTIEIPEDIAANFSRQEEDFSSEETPAEQKDPVLSAIEVQKAEMAALKETLSQYTANQEKMSREQKLEKIQDMKIQAKDSSDFELFAKLAKAENDLMQQEPSNQSNQISVAAHKFHMKNQWWGSGTPEANELEKQAIGIQNRYLNANPNASEDDIFNYVHTRLRAENPDNETLGTVVKKKEENDMVPLTNMRNTQRYTKVTVDKSDMHKYLNQSELQYLKYKQNAGDDEKSIERWFQAVMKDKQEGRR